MIPGEIRSFIPIYRESFIQILSDSIFDNEKMVRISCRCKKKNIPLIFKIQFWDQITLPFKGQDHLFFPWSRKIKGKKVVKEKPMKRLLNTLKDF
ncbi:MAG: hypothetical protein Q4P25_05265 [Tissierellia bacterium]|nr:hypothetical protein [Tissierellia bacterium]